MKRNVILGALSAALAGCLSLAILTACNGANKLADQDPYDESGFASGSGTTDIYADVPIDEDMTLDGNFTEERWNNKNWFSYTDSGVTVEATTSLSDLGVYVALRNNDNSIYYNSGRDIWLNSSFEIYIDRGDSMQKTENTLQVRMDYGKIETYQGYLADASYPWKVQFRPVRGKIQVQGELNSGNAEGMTCEMYVSWEALGYDMEAENFKAPENVKMFVAYSKPSGVDTTSRDAWCVNTESYNDTAQYWLFDANGYAQGDAEDAVIGNSPFNRVKTAGWDIKNNTATSTITGQQYAWFTQNGSETPAEDVNYAFTAKLKFKNALNDEWPSMGVTLASDDQNLYAFFVRAWDETTDSLTCDFLHRTYSGSVWDRTDGVGTVKGPFDIQEGVRLTGVKYGKTLFMFVGDENAEKYGGSFVALRSFNDIAGAAVPGFFTMGCSVEYSDYAMTTDSTEIDGLLDGYISKLTVESYTNGSLTGYEEVYPKSEETYASISVSADDGYYLSSLQVNGAERLGDVKEGVFTIQMNEDNVVVTPVFTGIKAATYRAVGAVGIESGVQMSKVEVIVQKKEEGALYIYRPYLVRQGGKYNVVLSLPDGTYDYYLKYDGNTVQETKFTVDGEELTLPEIGFKSTFGTGKGNSQAVGTWDTTLDPLFISADPNGTERCRYTFYKDGGNSTKFLFETVITTDGSLVNGCEWPMAGIVLQNTDTTGATYRMVVLIAAGAQSMSNWSRNATLITWYTGDGDGRVDAQEPGFVGARPTDAGGTKVTVVRDGVNLYVFVNDAFVINYKVRFTESMKTDVGLATAGGSLSTFSKFVYSEDATTLDEWITKANIKPEKVDLGPNGVYWLTDDAGAETGTSFYATGKFTHATGSGWATAGFVVTVDGKTYYILPNFDIANNNDTNTMIVSDNPWGARQYWVNGGIMDSPGNVEYTYAIAMKEGTLYVELSQGEKTVRQSITLTNRGAEWAAFYGEEHDTDFAALFGSGEAKVGLRCQDGSASVKDFSITFDDTKISAFIANFTD